MSEQNQGRLIPVPRWNDHYEWPPPGGLRHLIFYAATNGFNKVIRRAGRRILIDENTFHKWVEEQTDQHNAATARSVHIKGRPKAHRFGA